MPKAQAGERRPAPTRPRARPRREQIITAARGVLAERGLAGFTVLEVAAAVPISEPSVFYHFATKEDLLAEVSLEILADEVEAMQRACTSTRGIQSVLASLQCRFEFYEARPRELELAHVQGLGRFSPEQRRRAIETVNTIFDTWELALIEGKRGGSRASVRRRLGPIWLMSEGLLQMQQRVGCGLLETRFTPREMLQQVRKAASEILRG